MKKVLVVVLLLFLIPFSVFAQTPQEKEPALTILSPKDDVNLFGDSVEIVFVVNDFSLVDPQKQLIDKQGQGHIAMWVNSTDYEYGTAQVISKLSPLTVENLEPGDNNIRMELVTNKGKPLKPPVVAIIKFNLIGRPSAVVTDKPVISNIENRDSENFKVRADSLALFTSIAVGAILFLGGVVFLLFYKNK
ncbi:hypothetical protein HYT02_05525 [Candidatus Gottesmanbacteria bacterium]|nr:hypothetical protein [Candidatus Gottesmanbacteria bacterium]